MSTEGHIARSVAALSGNLHRTRTLNKPPLVAPRGMSAVWMDPQAEQAPAQRLCLVPPSRSNLIPAAGEGLTQTENALAFCPAGPRASGENWSRV